ncbi:hypothetical protein [Desulfosporosinus sp. I2]|uniref:hypothetical protein n=1 Tax=Desulfosporosinus sp. I2 TaxID=1617025 RepID=UPI0012E02C17|nr:hypothetical protein [Desulfosporosinus sp. I2]
MSALEGGAGCTVTPCPLCQMQLDMYQLEGKRAVNANVDRISAWLYSRGTEYETSYC